MTYTLILRLIEITFHLCVRTILCSFTIRRLCAKPTALKVSLSRSLNSTARIRHLYCQVANPGHGSPQSSAVATASLMVYDRCPFATPAVLAMGLDWSLQHAAYDETGLGCRCRVLP